MIDGVAVSTLQRLDVTVVEIQLHPQSHALRADFTRDLVKSLVTADYKKKTFSAFGFPVFDSCTRLQYSALQYSCLLFLMSLTLLPTVAFLVVGDAALGHR